LEGELDRKREITDIIEIEMQIKQNKRVSKGKKREI